MSETAKPTQNQDAVPIKSICECGAKTFIIQLRSKERVRVDPERRTYIAKDILDWDKFPGYNPHKCKPKGV